MATRIRQDMPTIVSDIEAAVRPALHGQGYDLICIEYLPASHILRLFLDSASGISIDDCAEASRLVGDILDAEGLSDRMDGSYNLEVSSPGLDRPLVSAEDFKRFQGHEARIVTHDSVVAQPPERRKFRGRILQAGDEACAIDVDGTPCMISYHSIKQARLVPQSAQEA